MASGLAGTSAAASLATSGKPASLLVLTSGKLAVTQAPLLHVVPFMHVSTRTIWCVAATQPRTLAPWQVRAPGVQAPAGVEVSGALLQALRIRQQRRSARAGMADNLGPAGPRRL